MDLRVLNARRALEATYGLALEAVTDSELARALAEAFPPGQEDFTERAALDRFVDLLPIDESSLFRNEPLWSWLEQSLLPQLLDACAAAMRPLRAVSLGCSSGQEPFSLAMLILRLLRERGVPASAAGSFASILGVDASAVRVEQARSGTLNAWSVQRARSAWVESMVEEERESPGRYRVNPAALALTRFEQRNLMELVEEPSRLSGAQLVFLQHVLVYFRDETATQVLQKLIAGLDPGAVLIVAPVEAHLLDRLSCADRTDYVGAVRVLRPGASRARPEVLTPPPVRAAPPPVRAAPPPPSAPPESAEAYVRVALEHLAKGRLDDALRAARAASYADPQSVYARLCVGQILLRVDAQRGRRVLEELAGELQSRADHSMAEHADGLSLKQLGEAIDLLLAGAR